MFSLATISFYFILFSFVGSILVKSLLKLFPNRLNMQGRILISAILQVTGLLILSFMPTAKTLVITVILMGAALGLHEFRLLDFYKDMIREDKQALAREILERGFASGVILGCAGYGVLFLFENIQLALLLFTLVMAVLLFAYPLITLLYTPVRPITPASPQEPPYNGPEDPFAQYQEVPDYGNPTQQKCMTNPPAGNDYLGEYPGQEIPFYNENRLYGQNRFNTGSTDEKEGDNRR